MTQSFIFGPFVLIPEQRQLMRDDQAIPLGKRVFDLLTALVKGRELTCDALKHLVWPELPMIGDHNLAVALSSLRGILDDRSRPPRFIATLPGRRYRFIAPVTMVETQPKTPTVVPSRPKSAHNLPVKITRLIGREADTAAVANVVSSHRAVTLVGTGGIGKTRLALAVAEAVSPQFHDGVWLVELASLSSGERIPGLIASVLGMAAEGDPLSSVIKSLREQNLLLVLDNCEHLISDVAAAAEAILHGAPGVRVLATSKEPLGIAGEHLYWLSVLASPEIGDELSAAEALEYPAVELLADRVEGALGTYTLKDCDASTFAQICRRLDGIPLALELVASRFRTMGLNEIAGHLDDRFTLLTKGFRTALPRQMTLEATMDWSYNSVSEPGRVLLRRLSIFIGEWTAAAARFVTADDLLPESGIDDLLLLLTDKSLIVVDQTHSEPRYHLLETMRYYAERMAIGSDEFDCRPRLARWLLDRFRTAEVEREVTSDERWLARYAPDIANIQTALKWAFDAGGDPSLGATLLAYSGMIWSMAGCYVDEGRWLSIAEAKLPAMPPEVAARIGRMRLLKVAYDDPSIWPTAQTVLRLAKSAGDEYLLSRVIIASVPFALASNNLQEAEALLREASLLIDASLSTRTLALWHLHMARTARSLGQAARVEVHFEQAIEIGLKVGATKLVASAYHELLFRRDQIDEGIAIFRQMIDRANGQPGQRSLRAYLLGLLSGYLIMKDDWEPAFDSGLRSLRMWRQIGHPVAFLPLLDRLAAIAAASGRSEQAARLLGYCDAGYASRGVPRRPALEVISDTTRARLGRRISNERLAILLAEGAALSEDQAVDRALATPAIA